MDIYKKAFFDKYKNSAEEKALEILWQAKNMNSLDISLSGLHLNDLSPLNELGNLELIDISNTGIFDINPLKAFINLKQLWARNNFITDIRPLKDLHQLKLLHLENNQIKDIKPLEELRNLTFVNITQTLVHNLFPLKKIIANGIKVKWYGQSWENGIYVNDCPLINPPKGIVERGNDAILNYWRQIE